MPRALAEWQVNLVVVAEPHVVTRDCRSIPALPGLATRVFINETSPGVAPSRDSAVARRLLQVLAGYVDAVHVEGSYLFDLLPTELRHRALVVEHNVESLLVAQRSMIASHCTDDLDIEALRAREEAAWRAAGAVAALTEDDVSEIRFRMPTVPLNLIPNGWDHLPARVMAACDVGQLTAPRLLFLANHEYAPNRDALDWLVTEIHPRIRQTLPRAQLVVAGANLPASRARTLRNADGVAVAGYVEDVTEQLDRADIVLCPLRIGGGIKVKTTEALRRGCLLVSTSIGAQGVPEPERSSIGIADEPDAFAQRVVRLSLDPAERLRRRTLLAQPGHEPITWAEAYARSAAIWHQLAGRVRPG